MQLKCPSGHHWEYLPHCDKDRSCPTCGKTGGADVESMGQVIFNAGLDQDLDRLDPLEVQFWMEHRQHHEDLILAGDRGSGAYIVNEKGPAWSRPFNNDPMERRRAIEERGYSKDGKY